MERNRVDFISAYMNYATGNECPANFHRWSAIGLLGAWLGRTIYFKHGHFKVHPNVYLMLMGSPGTKKSTAIKIATNLLRATGQVKIAADRTTKEKFILDLADNGEEQDILDKNLFGEQEGPAEIMIAADEFNNFIGLGNIEFLSLLGVLWDFNGTYENKVKNSQSVKITDPTVNILAGNTPTGFALAFPVESIGQGIFSRLLLIHGEPTGKRITFPRQPTEEETAVMLDWLTAIRKECHGQVELTEAAADALDRIYQSWQGIPDVRFDAYCNRRFTHLLKLCLIAAASRASNILELGDVVYANTLLTHAEHTMPQALGTFGKSKHSDVAHKIIQVLGAAHGLVTLRDLWAHVHTDLDRMTDLADILRNLQAADKIIQSNGGFLLRRSIIQETNADGLVDYSLLTDEERRYIV